MPTPSKKPVDPAIVQKLSEGWRYVTIPGVDLYDQPFDGLWINRDHYKPGKHLLAEEVADEIEKRLAIWQDAMIRLSNPKPNRSAQEAALSRGLAGGAGVEINNDLGN